MVPAPGSKSVVSLKSPVVYTLPDESSAIEVTVRLPIGLTHTRFPDESNFNTNVLSLHDAQPAVRLAVPGPGSKSTVPVKDPVM